jgi:hypothetical protein
MDRVGKPNVGACPLEVFGVLERSAAELAETEVLFVLGFRQVSM